MTISTIMLVVSTSLIAPGWLAAHYLGLRKTASDKRRDLRLQYQIDAYRALMTLVNSGLNSEEDFHLFENCINDVMLFGSQEQIDIIRRDMPPGGSLSVGSLLINIRNSLRAELGLTQELDSGGWGMSWTPSEQPTTAGGSAS